MSVLSDSVSLLFTILVVYIHIIKINKRFLLELSYISILDFYI